MPINQSVSARHLAASAKLSSSEPGLKFEKPWTIADFVIDRSHKRSVGFSFPKNSTISRKINSPSRPASQALITRPTSFLSKSFLIVRIRSLCPDFFLSPIFSGTIGSTSRVQALYFSSTSCGASNSKRWPTAKVTTKSSPSKNPSFSSKPPRATARSLATLGFSVMTNAFDTVPPLFKVLNTV